MSEICSDLVDTEGIAGIRVTTGEPGAKPSLPLRRGPVRKRFRHYRTATLSLQCVIADRTGRIQCFIYVTGFENVARLVRVVSPDAGQAIGLQLETHGKRVTFRLAQTLLHRVNLT